MQNIDRFNNVPRVKKSRLNIVPENPEKDREELVVGPGRFPSWLHRKLPENSELLTTAKILSQNTLHTVCEEAKCPNLPECWTKKTATFLAMGKECTRNCGFCDIDFSRSPKNLEEDEPGRIADSVQALGLQHVVITMVARDDLSDGGAVHLSKIVDAIRRKVPNATIELLTSDFRGNFSALDIVLGSLPEIFNHNIETVRELTPRVRHTATYDRTLSVLSYAKIQRPRPEMLIKSGLMVGLGETKDQIKQTLEDLHSVGCDIVTIGQYLQADSRKLRVKAFIHPDEFKEYEEYGYSLGIPYIYAGPFVRSSYNANVVIKQANNKIKTIQST